MKSSIPLFILAAVVVPRIAVADDDAAARSAVAQKIHAEADQERARRSTSGSAFLITEGLALGAAFLIGVAVPQMKQETQSSYSMRQTAGYISVGFGAAAVVGGTLWNLASPSQRFELHPSQGLIAFGSTAALVGTVMMIDGFQNDASNKGTVEFRAGGGALAATGAGIIAGGVIWALLSGPKPEPVRPQASTTSITFTPFGVFGQF